MSLHITSIKLLVLSTLILLISPYVISADCSTPADCYIKALATLNQDREEMRRQLDSYQSMYDQAGRENQKLKENLNQLENTFTSKISELSQNLNNQLQDVKNYLERPFKTMDNIIYQGNSLTSNLSTLPLNGLVPSEAKRMLVYVAYHSGAGYEQHGDIHFFTKVSGNMQKRSLKFDGYQQNAYNSNSSVFEMELDGVDLNLYFKSDVNYDRANFYIVIKLLGYK